MWIAGVEGSCGTHRTSTGVLGKENRNGKVVIPTVIGFMSLMGVWVAFEAASMMAM